MTTNKTLPKWTDERVQALVEVVGSDYNTLIARETVEELASSLETTTRSIASKLRKMGYTGVPSLAAAAKAPAFTETQEAELRKFVETNAGLYTYEEIAAFVLNDATKARSIQGKLLSMELTDKVKKAEPKVVEKKYTDEETAVVQSMMEAGSYLEDIVEAVGKSIASVRGKALSINKATGIAIPKQKVSNAKEKVDAFDALTNIAEMTVEDIAGALDKSVRGIKSMLTHRGITCANYDGAKKAEKNAAKKEAATA